MPLLEELDAALRRAVAEELGPEFADQDPILGPTRNPEFGDYQANFAMALARRVGRKPRDLAEKVAARLEGCPLLAAAEVAGPGFVNLRLDDDALGRSADAMLGDERLGAAPAAEPETVVVDYGSPNLAKEMHVGHLRSAIIGDALARVLEFLGHAVVRQNHVGDWGTQFGMLLEHLMETGAPIRGGAPRIEDLDALYQEAKRRDDADADFARRARERVVALQGGEAEASEIWRALITESVRHMNDVLGRLGVALADEHLRPESFYQDRLGGVAADLEAEGLAVESDGALCVFLDPEKPPLIVRKSDGGYGYSATDLAALRYRIVELGATRLVYVVDARQRDHFQQLFGVAREAGWVPESVRLEHVAFGTVLGPDGKPFKTREGGTVKLAALLDEAVARAADAVRAKAPSELGDEERERIARVVGIGAVKYADLSNDRVKDYVFDWDRMLALEGNTAPYLINAYVRIRSIFRRGGIGEAEAAGGRIVPREAAERALLLHLLEWPVCVERVGETLQPHHLCTWLHGLATAYHHFYERCPVLAADEPGLRASRLALSALVGSALRVGLSLLGIGVVDRM